MNLSDLAQQFRDAGTRARAFEGTQSVAVTDVLPDSFIKNHTEYNTLDELFAAAGLGSLEGDDLKTATETDEFSQFIVEHTEFAGGWDEMVKRAGREYFERKIYGPLVTPTQ